VIPSNMSPPLRDLLGCAAAAAAAAASLSMSNFQRCEGNE
jgi:hypothetical protein